MTYDIYCHHSDMIDGTSRIIKAYSKYEMERELRSAIDAVPAGISATIKVYNGCRTRFGKPWFQSPVRQITVNADSSVHIIK